MIPSKTISSPTISIIKKARRLLCRELKAFQVSSNSQVVVLEVLEDLVGLVAQAAQAVLVAWEVLEELHSREAAT